MKNRVLKQMPSPISNFSSWSSARLGIFDCTYINGPDAFFDCVSFVLTYAPFPDAKIDAKYYSLGTRKITTINSGQRLGARESLTVPLYTTIFMDPLLLDTVSQQMYGKQNVQFSNFSSSISPDLLFLLKQYRYEAASSEMNRFSRENLETMMSITLLRSLSHNCAGKEPRRSGIEKNAVKTAQQFMHDNISADFSLDEVAEAVNYSNYHFIRMFKATAGTTPFEYLTRIRIEHAKTLLSLPSFQIRDISLACGYKNISHFTTVFKRTTGSTPGVYRKSTL